MRAHEKPTVSAVRKFQKSAKRIGSAEVRNLCNDISDMTLWRWIHEPSIAFPQPIYIGRRRYWREAEIEDWLDSHSTKRSQN